MTGAADIPDNLSDMYSRLCSYKETAAKGYSRGGKAVFGAVANGKSTAEKKTRADKPKAKAVSFKKPAPTNPPKKSALKKTDVPVPDLVSDDDSDNDSIASKDVEFFFCHKMGHYARDCPQKANQ